MAAWLLYLNCQQEVEAASLSRRVRLVDDDFEQTSARLHSATVQLEDASSLAEETERFSSFLTMHVV